jgi:hypothetical protein
MYLLILMSSSKIIDGIITDYSVSRGLVREGNPLVADIITDGSFLWFKIAGALLCVLALWGLSRRFPRLTRVTTASITIFYGAVIAWNLGVLLGA